MSNQPNHPTEVEESVIAKIRQRREAGRAKYGTTMERTDLTCAQWLQHAQEEAMDLAIYLERLLREDNDTAGAYIIQLESENNQLRQQVADLWAERDRRSSHYTKTLNRRVDVENILASVATGKRDALTPDECRDLAIKLGVSPD
jgi:hypothetical protein